MSAIKEYMENELRIAGLLEAEKTDEMQKEMNDHVRKLMDVFSVDIQFPYTVEDPIIVEDD